MFCINVHHRRVFSWCPQDRIRSGRSNLRWQKHPLHHLILIFRTTRCPPCSQFAVAVQQMAEKLETLQEACFGTKSTVIDFCEGAILNVGSFHSEVVIVTYALIRIHIRNKLTIIYRCYRGTADFTVEHTVHHHRLKIVGCGSDIIITHNTACITTSIHIGITEAVDHARTTVKQTNYTTHIATTCDRTTTIRNRGITFIIGHRSTVSCQHTTIIDAGITLCLGTDGTDISTTADIHIIQNHILDNSTISISH